MIANEILEGSFDEALLYIDILATKKQHEKRAEGDWTTYLSGLAGQAGEMASSAGSAIGDAASGAANQIGSFIPDNVKSKLSELWATPEVRNALIGAGIGGTLGAGKALLSKNRRKHVLTDALFGAGLGGAIGGGGTAVARNLLPDLQLPSFGFGSSSGSGGGGGGSSGPAIPTVNLNSLSPEQRELYRRYMADLLDRQRELGILGIPIERARSHGAAHRAISRTDDATQGLEVRGSVEKLAVSGLSDYTQQGLDYADQTMDNLGTAADSVLTPTQNALGRSLQGMSTAIGQGQFGSALAQADVLGLKNLVPGTGHFDFPTALKALLLNQGYAAAANNSSGIKNQLLRLLAPNATSQANPFARWRLGRAIRYAPAFVPNAPDHAFAQGEVGKGFVEEVANAKGKPTTRAVTSRDWFTNPGKAPVNPEGNVFQQWWREMFPKQEPAKPDLTKQKVTHVGKPQPTHTAINPPAKPVVRNNYGYPLVETPSGQKINLGTLWDKMEAAAKAKEQAAAGKRLQDKQRFNAADATYKARNTDINARVKSVEDSLHGRQKIPTKSLYRRLGGLPGILLGLWPAMHREWYTPGGYRSGESAIQQYQAAQARLQELLRSSAR